MTDLDKVAVPKEWQALGFSGLFHTVAHLDCTDAELDAFEARLPTRVPVGTNGPTLALRVDRGTREVVLVRLDMQAVADIMLGPVFP